VPCRLLYLAIAASLQTLSHLINQNRQQFLGQIAKPELSPWNSSIASIAPGMFILPAALDGHPKWKEGILIVYAIFPSTYCDGTTRPVRYNHLFSTNFLSEGQHLLRD